MKGMNSIFANSMSSKRMVNIFSNVKNIINSSVNINIGTWFFQIELFLVLATLCKLLQRGHLYVGYPKEESPQAMKLLILLRILS